jgi:hypothetical protein
VGQRKALGTVQMEFLGFDLPKSDWWGMEVNGSVLEVTPGNFS